MTRYENPTEHVYDQDAETPDPRDPVVGPLEPYVLVVDVHDPKVRAELTRAVLQSYDADTKAARPLTTDEFAAVWPHARHDEALQGTVDRVLFALAAAGHTAREERGLAATGPTGGTTEVLPAAPGSAAAGFPASRGGRRRYVTPWRPA